MKIGKTLFRGIIRTMYGAVSFGMVLLSIYSFMCVDGECGYLAVLDFMLGLVMAGVAIANMCEMGKAMWVWSRENNRV